MNLSEYRTPRKSGANVFRALTPVPGTQAGSEGRAGRARLQKPILVLQEPKELD